MNNINLNYLYIGLFNSGVLGLTEISQDKTNYRRVEMGPGDWELIGLDNVTNIVSIKFPKSISSWGIVTHFGIFDSLNGGKLLVVGVLNKNRFVEKNEEIEFDIGKTDIALEALGIYDK